MLRSSQGVSLRDAFQNPEDDIVAQVRFEFDAKHPTQTVSWLPGNQIPDDWLPTEDAGWTEGMVGAAMDARYSADV